MYGESRKPVQGNPFAGQECRCRSREQTSGRGGAEGRLWGESGAWGWRRLTATCEPTAGGSLLCRPGAQRHALWRPRWARGAEWGIYGHIWLLLLIAQQKLNTAKQLFLNKKEKDNPDSVHAFYLIAFAHLSLAIDGFYHNENIWSYLLTGWIRNKTQGQIQPYPQHPVHVVRSRHRKI